MKKDIVKMSAVACLCTLCVGIVTESFADPRDASVVIPCSSFIAGEQQAPKVESRLFDSAVELSKKSEGDLANSSALALITSAKAEMIAKAEATFMAEGSSEILHIAEQIEDTLKAKMTVAKLEADQEAKIRDDVRSLSKEIQDVLTMITDQAKEFIPYLNNKNCQNQLMPIKVLVWQLKILCNDTLRSLNEGITADFKTRVTTDLKINEKNAEIEHLLDDYNDQTDMQIKELEAEIEQLKASLKGNFCEETLKNLKENFYKKLSETISNFSRISNDINWLQELHPDYRLLHRILGNNVVKNEVTQKTLKFVKSLTERYCDEDIQALHAINEVEAMYGPRNSVPRDIFALCSTAFGSAFSLVSHIIKTFANTGIVQQVVSVASWLYPNAEIRPLLGQISKLMCYGTPAATMAGIVAAPVAYVASAPVATCAFFGVFLSSYFSDSIGNWGLNFGKDLSDPSKAFGEVVKNYAKQAANGIYAKVSETANNVKRAGVSIFRKIKKAVSWLSKKGN